MNNFAEKLSILTKRIIQFWLQDTLRKLPSWQESFQVSLNFSFVKAKFMKKSSITSTIYRRLLCHCVKKEK